jgi:small subunit ribosomal protein S1
VGVTSCACRCATATAAHKVEGVTEPEPIDLLQTFLNSVQPGEARMGTVAGFDGLEVVVDLEGSRGTHRAVGRIVRHELSWRRAEDPAEIVSVGQAIEVEVIGVDLRRGCVLLSAKACEDQALRAFLVGIRRGEILTGTVADVRNFGVFVNLDGEPADSITGYNGTGFIRVPELSWSHIDHASDVVEVGQRVRVEVLNADTRQGQVALSLKALREDPLIRFADHVGEVVSGQITKIVPFGVFVRVAEGIEGLLHLSDLSDKPVDSPDEIVQVGEAIAVRIVEVDLQRHRVRLGPVRVTASPHTG